MNLLRELMTGGPVAWLSVLMVIGCIAIIVFLSFKVKALMNRDAEAHKNQPK